MGYSPTYLKTINNQLSAIFNYAVRYYDLKSNPCAKAGSMGKSKAEEMDFWTGEEFRKFIDSVMNKRLSYMAFMTLYWTGMRLGELLALNPKDVDLEKRTITITKSYQRLGKKDVITPPKTPKSKRVITIPEFLAADIRDYIDSLYELQENDRLFPITKYYLEHEMQRGIKESGVKRIRVHDLRHSHASMLIELGFSPLEIANRLGHEKVETTLNTYAHLYPNKAVDFGIPQKRERLIIIGTTIMDLDFEGIWEETKKSILLDYPDYFEPTTVRDASVNRILGKIAEFSKAAADNAAGGPQPKFYLVVDEINRANLATVFGELIYGLEYRNSKVSTPYEVKNNVTGDITKDIVLGKNLFILGTMNTADKSIDAIDYAIRRRFIFIDSPANRDIVMKCYQNVSGNTDENSIELLLFDAVQRIFDDSRFFNNEYQKSDVRIGHTYFLRDRKRGYEDAIIEHFIFQVIPILREYVKDGILDVTENLVPLEHVVSEIHSAGSGEEQIELLSENIMLYVKEFGNLTKSNATIDNEYIGKFLDDLRKEFGY